MSAPRACAHELTLSESPFSADNSTVEAAEQAWRPLGELLLSKNLIARTELDQALSEQEETGKLAEHLTEQGLVIVEAPMGEGKTEAAQALGRIKAAEQAPAVVVLLGGDVVQRAAACRALGEMADPSQTPARTTSTH